MFPRRLTLALALSAALAAPGTAHAGGSATGVIELFTSQGCSSCPPADANLDAFAAAGDVVALGYHVDYWDYLGWKDTLGSAANSERQHGYARTLGARSVYTPQAVLNGSAHVNGADAGAIRNALAARTLSVPVTLSRVEDRVVAATGDGPAPQGEAVIVFVWTRSEAAVTIERGENRGETIRYVNAVMAISTTGMYHGAAGQFEMPVSEAKKAGADGCAVLVQEIGVGGTPGAILGAAQIRL